MKQSFQNSTIIHLQITRLLLSRIVLILLLIFITGIDLNLSAQGSDPLPAQCGGASHHSPENPVSDCDKTSPYWSSDLKHLPNTAARKIRIRVNLIILQKDNGEGNFRQSDPEEMDFINDWFQECNNALGELNGTVTNCNGPFFPSTKIELVPNWIFLPYEYGWNNDNNPTTVKACYNSTWYLINKDNEIHTDPNILEGINIYFTVSGDIYHQLVTLGTINTAAGMPYFWTATSPSTTNLTISSRVHVVNLYLKYRWFKDHPGGTPFSTSREWLVAEGRILAHEIGHSHALPDLLNANCSNNLMTTNSSDRNVIEESQVSKMHRMLAISSLRQFIDCNETYQPDNDLNGFDDDQDLFVTSNETWDLNMRLYRNVVIKSGGHLTVTCKLLMPENGRITVERDAQLTVDGGTITKANTCGNSQYWRGVYVNHDTKHQQPIAGVVMLRNEAFIEEAIVGVSTNRSNTDQTSKYWGGVVDMDNSTFRNCRKGVEFMKYDLPNPSKFVKANFIRTATGSSYAGVTIWDTDGIYFEKYTFDGMAETGI